MFWNCSEEVRNCSGKRIGIVPGRESELFRGLSDGVFPRPPSGEWRKVVRNNWRIYIGSSEGVAVEFEGVRKEFRISGK